jgi:hypothetical protein
MREGAEDIQTLAYLCQQSTKKEYDKEKICRGQKHRRRVGVDSESAVDSRE